MKKFLAVLLSFGVSSFATVNFPYPQAHKYGNNTIIADIWNCAGQSASSLLKQKFVEYVRDFYEESGNQARIKFDDKNITVSEGIGYGMILMVYFSDNTTSYQGHFDKLWNYYNAHLDGNGVMNWKIRGFNSGCEGCGAATDADEDVAFALTMAYYQFGDNKYKTAAESLIPKIRKSLFSSNGMHKLGDNWDNFKNPSYVSPAAYEIFKKFDVSGATFWNSAIETNYNLLKKNVEKTTTGIPSGWASNQEPYGAIVGNNGYSFAGYDYDATRAPWRWSWSYAWFGHSDALTLASKLASWVSTKTSAQLKINMKQDGTTDANVCSSNGCTSNGSSIGSLSTVLITNSSYQNKLNDNFIALISQQPGYYHSSLRLLTGLLMTGNMQNFSTGYKNQPYELKLTEEQIAKCNEKEEVYENSGAFGWNSVTAVLSDEANDGVQIGRYLSGTRDVTRELGEVVEGQSYVFSMKIAQHSYNPYIYFRPHIYENSDMETDYCGGSQKLLADESKVYSCEFTAKSSGKPLFQLTANNGDEPTIIISDFALKSSDGSVVEPPVVEPPKPNSNSSTAIMPVSAEKADFGLQGKSLRFAGLSTTASLNVMDVQGRLVMKSRIEPNSVADLSHLPSGSYIVQLRTQRMKFTKNIVLK